MNLEGKTALITGGYRGIGLACSRALAKSGSHIAIAARSLEKCEDMAKTLSNEYRINAKGFYLDVSNKESVQETVDMVTSEFHTIDILINAAGISGVQKPIIDLSEDEFDEVFNIDLKGTLFVCQAVSRLMMAQNSGKIINIASVLGKIATPYMAGYCISKASVIQLTKVMALELAKHNIQVNVICPGYFLTDINKAFFESERGKRYIKERIPLNRLGKLEEIESTIIYLSSAPAFLTGAEIVIDGAQTVI
jgi:gluconate 5-dehydrogenase